MEYREEFKKYVSMINREGINELTAWLEQSGYFTDPASTRFHEAYEGGLLEHSIVVTKILFELNGRCKNVASDESAAICGLFHDVCKVGFYKRSTRNVKNEETGQWEKVPVYIVDDKFPFGHGEKSVYLIERFMRLKPAEAIAIRQHMGPWDEGNVNTISKAYNDYPLAAMLALADQSATFLKAQLGFEEQPAR